jgi:hypothetical protein
LSINLIKGAILSIAPFIVKTLISPFNLLSAFYVTQKDSTSTVVRIPVGFELILKTLAFCVIKDKKLYRKSPITKNEMCGLIKQCIHNQLLFKYVLASWFASTDNMHFIQEQKKLLSLI